VEIEAKYAISDRAVFEALLELRTLGPYSLRPAGERHVIDHYLDTKDHRLRRAGYACRLREGLAEGQWRLTVKGLGKVEGAVHERPELECDVAPRSALADWPEGPAREMVSRLSEGQPLAELFALRQDRSDRAVEEGDRGVGQLSLDVVEANIAGSGSLGHELEIELGPTGSLDDLDALEGELRPYNLTPQSMSKFERALALLEAGSRAPKARKRAIGVRADEPMAEAGRKILRFHFDRMVANEKDTRKGEDIEALHHMRVATRRQRAALRIVSPYFKRKPLQGFRDELRTLADRLGAVRDLDVLIESAERHRAKQRPEAAAAFDLLLEEWRRQRGEARHLLLRHLDRGAYGDFMTRYGEFLSSPGAGVKEGGAGTPHPRLVRHVLPAELWDHYGRVRAYETMVTWASIETLHALRIEAKRLRYLLEFFAEVLGPGLAGSIDALVRLQDHIGELHDADVTIGLLRDFLMRRAQAAPNPALAEAVGRYLKLTETRLRTLQRTVKKPWRRVAGPRLRTALGRAVARL
jgi:CHAD domain-containing protein/uncharacterized protein YjbK